MLRAAEMTCLYLLTLTPWKSRTFSSDAGCARRKGQTTLWIMWPSNASFWNTLLGAREEPPVFQSRHKTHVYRPMKHRRKPMKLFWRIMPKAGCPNSPRRHHLKLSRRSTRLYPSFFYRFLSKRKPSLPYPLSRSRYDNALIKLLSNTLCLPKQPLQAGCVPSRPLLGIAKALRGRSCPSVSFGPIVAASIWPNLQQHSARSSRKSEA